MQNNNSGHSIFILPVQDKFLLYAPLHELSALLNEAAAWQLKRALLASNPNSIMPEMADLISVLQAPPVQNPDRSGELDPQFLGIIPSRRCNMSCVYCDFGANLAPEEVIDPDIVVSAIDYFAALTEQKKKHFFLIQFFGGEPFVEQEIIDIAVHHARLVGSKTGIIPHFEALTNGYFSEHQRIFIKDYFDRIVISFDGFKKYHDKTRPINSRQGSFEKVVDNIKYLSTSNVELSIRCCITSESVGEMEEMARWFCEEFNPDKINFETLTPNQLTEQEKIYPPDPYQFAQHCVRSWRILRENHVEPAYAPVSLDRAQTTSCPVGRDVLIVHPDGAIASCYLLRKDWEDKQLDLCVGQVHKNGKVEVYLKKIKQLRNPLYTKPRCENCFCRFGCAGNCHVNCTYPGASPAYTDFCIHTRIITACQLLENMGQQTIVEEMLDDTNALKHLALQKSDHLFDFKGGS
ncbi:radical SAM protein [candidate division KSB1 bacterium]|nr:radical SAM protein [candidate division KSB1 bacterium]